MNEIKTSSDKLANNQPKSDPFRSASLPSAPQTTATSQQDDLTDPSHPFSPSNMLSPTNPIGLLNPTSPLNIFGW